jgi:hypothetical protein
MARSVPSWFDQKNMEHGVEVDEGLRRPIKECSAMIIICSSVARKEVSQWVMLEIEEARDAEIPIEPLFIDPPDNCGKLGNLKGEIVPHPAMVPFAIEEILRRLNQKATPWTELESTWKRLIEIEPIFAAQRKAEKAKEVLNYHIRALSSLDLHLLDVGLRLLYKLMPTDFVALTVADIFSQTGCGYSVLVDWSKKIEKHSIGKALVQRVATSAVSKKLPSDVVRDFAINILSNSEIRLDGALYRFLQANGELLTERQLRKIRILVNHPPIYQDLFFFDASFEVIRLIPEANEVVDRISFEILDGAFDKKPHYILNQLSRTGNEELFCTDQISESIRSRVRHLGRDGTLRSALKMEKYLFHIFFCRVPGKLEILREGYNCIGSVEWNDWARNHTEAALKISDKVTSWLERMVADEE